MARKERFMTLNHDLKYHSTWIGSRSPESLAEIAAPEIFLQPVQGM
jgi:hypothetical protein